MEQLARELHKPVRHKFKRRKVITNGLNDVFGADLVDMGELKDGEYRYILTVIDVFSKYAWAIPLKDKRGNTILEALKRIFMKRKPLKLWVDQGGEFYNKNVLKYLDDMKIHIYSTYGESHNAVIERFNRTLKTEMWRRFTEKQNYNWVKMLPDLLKWYNNKEHSTIKMTPTEASKEENTSEIFEREKEKKTKAKAKYNIGDKVRISKMKTTFEKGYTAKWTKEIFTVYKILNTNPITYKLKDFEGSLIEGSFYAEELQKTKLEDIYLIEKVLKKSKGKVFVKWVGFDDKYNSWINESELYELNEINK